jgi:hypothetical protein
MMVNFSKGKVMDFHEWIATLLGIANDPVRQLRRAAIKIED